MSYRYISFRDNLTDCSIWLLNTAPAADVVQVHQITQLIIKTHFPIISSPDMRLF